MAGNILVSQVETIDFPGLKFGRNLKSDINLLISAINSLAGVARCFRVHLPTRFAADVVRALLVGKIGCGIAAAFFPCLSQDDPLLALALKLQVLVNGVARILCGSCRSDSLPIASLLEQVCLPSVNRLAVKFIVIEA